MSDNDTFTEWYTSLSDPLFRYCYFRIYDRERSVEIVQEAFARIWKELVKGTEIQNGRALLYRIVRNLIIDDSRKKKSLSLETLHEMGFEPSEDPSEAQVDLIDAKQILQKLDLLDEAYREVLLLRYVDQLKPKEIAEVLGESSNVISVRIYRGLKQLREIVHTN